MYKPPFAIVFYVNRNYSLKNFSSVQIFFAELLIKQYIHYENKFEH